MGVVHGGHLPGDVIAPAGSFCDAHSDAAAVASIVGETDSMGSETREVCQACLDKHKKEQQFLRENQDQRPEEDCESCGKSSRDVKPCRDPDEGMAGPLYYWCKRCRAEFFEYHTRD